MAKYEIIQVTREHGQDIIHFEIYDETPADGRIPLLLTQIVVREGMTEPQIIEAIEERVEQEERRRAQPIPPNLGKLVGRKGETGGKKK